MRARAAGWAAAFSLAVLPVVVLLVVVLPVALLVAGCTYYPTVRDVGGVRLQPEEGRVVRQANANAAVLHLQLKSTGKYGDILVGAETPIARRTELLSPEGAAVGQIEIPGETTVKFGEGGPRVVLSDLTRTLTPGGVVIVTLHFQKYGALGIISVVQ